MQNRTSYIWINVSDQHVLTREKERVFPYRAQNFYSSLMALFHKCDHLDKAYTSTNRKF